MDNKKYIKKIIIDSISGFEDFCSIFGKYQDLHKNCIFRGESDYRYKLLPSILRENTLEEVLTNYAVGAGEENRLTGAEYTLLSHFYRIANINGLYVPENTRINEYLSQNFDWCYASRFDLSEKWLPKDLYEIASLAQHYGVPTRLIDWSTSYKIALYFATVSSVKKTKNKPEYFTLWALDINTINSHSLINSQFPIKIIRPVYKNNENLKAQRGLFTMYEIDKPSFKQNSKTEEEAHGAIKFYLKDISKKTFDEILEEKIIENYEKYDLDIPQNPALYKFCISTALDNKILELLYHEGINGASIYPGYKGVAKTVEELKYLDKSIVHRV